MGSGNWLVNLATSLAQAAGVELHIISHSSKTPSDRYFEHNQIHFHLLRYKFPGLQKGFPHYFRLDTFSKYAAFRAKAVKLVRSIDPDIVHADGTEGAYAVTALDLKKEYPSVVSIQGVIHDLVKRHPSVFFRIQKLWERKAILGLDHFGCRTVWDKGFVSELNPKATVHYMPEAIDDVFFNTQWLGIGTKKILFVGTIVQRKGIEDLIVALAQLRKTENQLHLSVVGGGNSEYVKGLKHRCETLGISNHVHWLGFLDSAKIAQELSNTAAYVLPSYSDNSPNSLCEAMAVGVPSVAYSTGGIPSLMTKGKDGFLSSTGSIQELIEGIQFCLQPDNAARISTAAQERAKGRNSRDQVTQVTLQVYKNIVKDLQ